MQRKNKKRARSCATESNLSPTLELKFVLNKLSLPLILLYINIVPDKIIGSILRLKYGKDELMNAASRSKSDVSERNTSGLLPFSFDCGSWYDISKSLKTMTKKKKK